MVKKGTILIVDDNKNNRDMCKLFLEVEGYHVYYAENGEEGLHLTEQVNPDVILLDLLMPKMDGYQMLNRLKTNAPINDIPVFILTVKTEPNDVVKAFQMGASDYLKKPYNPDEFIARVDILVKQKRTQESLRKATENLLENNKYLEHKLRKWKRVS